MTREQLIAELTHLPAEERRALLEILARSLREQAPAGAQPSASGTLKLGWRGALRHLQGQCTAMELQKMAFKAWGG